MGRALVDIQQLLPLPEAVDYQIQLRKKAAEERKSGGPDWTRYDLTVGSKTFISLYKRELFLQAIRAIINHGVPVSELQSIIPAGKFLGVEGRLGGPEFRDLASKMNSNRSRIRFPKILRGRRGSVLFGKKNVGSQQSVVYRILAPA
jgi:hypothetical protein